MRIWSIHPKYLDTKGLVALWREALLAKHVLEGKTKGYRNHPQLDRFKQTDRPVDAIYQYLAAVHDEALARGYNFDRTKIDRKFISSEITVTTGQIKYETAHLLSKLMSRDKARFDELQKLHGLELHPLFKTVNGGIEKWEVIY